MSSESRSFVEVVGDYFKILRQVAVTLASLLPTVSNGDGKSLTFQTGQAFAVLSMVRGAVRAHDKSFVDLMSY